MLTWNSLAVSEFFHIRFLSWCWIANFISISCHLFGVYKEKLISALKTHLVSSFQYFLYYVYLVLFLLKLVPIFRLSFVLQILSQIGLTKSNISGHVSSIDNVLEQANEISDNRLFVSYLFFNVHSCYVLCCQSEYRLLWPDPCTKPVVRQNSANNFEPTLSPYWSSVWYLLA